RLQRPMTRSYASALCAGNTDAGAVLGSKVDDIAWHSLQAARRIGWRTRSAAFSAIMIVAALVFPDTTAGMIEASTTRSAPMPRTRSSGSTTAIGSLPILHVLVGWNTVPPYCFA